MVALPGCSLRKMAVNRLGDALAGGTSTYAEDDDPELIGDAVPFALKTVDSLLKEAPRHRGLLLAGASGYAQYAYGWLQQEADFVEDADLARATHLRGRAKRLYLRAREYGLRGLEVELPGFRVQLRRDAAGALARARRGQVPLLYWTGMSWFGAMALALDDSELTADQNLAEAMMRRALELDEGYLDGSIHDFFIAWEARGESVGGSFERAQEHFERAVALSHNRRAWPYVARAESIAVGQQDRAIFEDALHKALAVDPDAAPEYRLNNVIVQRRARWLLEHEDDLFVE